MNPRARKAKTDANQAEIIRALEKVGVVVKNLSGVGEGMNDLFCAIPEVSFLIECKVPGEQLNATQKDWHRKCPWRNHVVWNVEQALAIVAFYRNHRRAA